MVVFTQDQITSKTGYFTLEWNQENNSTDSQMYLYHKTNSTWQILYQGTNARYSVSGLLDGKYEYAICKDEYLSKFPYSSVESSILAKPNCSFAKAEIQHYNSNQTIGFLSVGILLFLSIFITILSFTFFNSKGTQ